MSFEELYEAIKKYTDENDCTCCILERENGVTDTILTTEAYEALSEFVKGSGTKLLVLERPESELDEDEFFSYEVAAYQIESLREFFPELDIQRKSDK